MEQKLHDAASRLPEASLAFDTIQPVPDTGVARRSRRAIASLAACVVLLISIGFGSYAYAAEVREYNDAVQFFSDYGLSTQGLTRGEIKAVYRDITTESFTYSKTAEVIESSLAADPVSGFEILQEDPTPQDVENLWNYKTYNGWFFESEPDGIHYEYRSEYNEDGHVSLDKSYLEKYDGETLVWSAEISEFAIGGYSAVSDGVIAYGETVTWSSAQNTYAWIAKFDTTGSLIWQDMLNHGFEDEYIAAVLENADGSYAVISRGDLKHFCLGQYTADGKETHFQKTEVGNCGIWDAACFGDGYIVQFGSFMDEQYASITMVDREGNITQSFSYDSEDTKYHITDIIGFDGKIYLSAYAVPKLDDGYPSYGGRYEIAPILDYLYGRQKWDISSEELTPMVRDQYTAILLVCDPEAGTPQEFYSVKGSLGGKLSLSDSGTLLWDVESITTTFYSPSTSSFTIGGTCYVFRYTFDASGTWIGLAKTDEITDFRR